jgi:hypothetical protein
MMGPNLQLVQRVRRQPNGREAGGASRCDSESTSRNDSRQQSRCRMKITRRIEISVERHEVSVLRRNRQAVIQFCDHCGAKVEMLTVESACAITGMTPRMLYRSIETENVHYVESLEGVILLCSESLKALN